MVCDEKKMLLLKRNQNFLHFDKVVEICSTSVETFILFDLCTWYFLLVRNRNNVLIFTSNAGIGKLLNIR
jgi:hypothetical protein